MGRSTRKQGCPNCSRLEAKLAKLQERIAALESELAKARKNSSNSSKPPSSDIVNPPPKSGKKGKRSKPAKRKRGGQPGHPRHQREPFQPDEIDVTWMHYYTGCPCCGGELIETEVPDKILQQVEIEQIPIRVTEHRRPVQRCVGCDKFHYVAWPEDLKKAGLVGPRLTALIGYLKSACHMSFSAIRKYLRDVVQVTLSRGHPAPPNP